MIKIQKGKLWLFPPSKLLKRSPPQPLSLSFEISKYLQCFHLAWILFLLKAAQLCLLHLGLPVRGKTILSAPSTQSVMASQGKAGSGDLVTVERWDREEVREANESP